ncbi:kinase-like domain-containing protein [Roridomyces roridus]|uniref:Kinase-like domain-containing protein n=1 Tax=Roridomyces roridus TaxID=1738132 RepID=A0AAD7CE67_9AGAR|nr:kinase-like domain-containing protein [Roridomyces roridus]
MAQGLGIEHVPVYHEDRVLEMLSSGPLASNPSDRCIQMMEILPVPDDPKFSVIVLPFLYRWNLIPFSTVGEVVEFFSQVFEGLHFLHKNHIWHGDIKDNNILMDATPLLPGLAHPWRPRLTRNLASRTRFRNRLKHPVKYYLIDFDLSGVHDPSSGPPFMLTGYGGNRGVPEFAVQEQPCDPFPVDVYCLGNMIKVFFTEGDELYRSEKIPGFEFIQSLVADMMKEDPAKRPNMDEVVRRFDEIRGGLSGWKLRSRCAPVDESRVSRIFRSTIHWTRQFCYAVRRIPTIPTPS